MSLRLELVNQATKAYNAFMGEAKKKDKSNAGSRFAEWFFWDELSRIAEKRAKDIKEKMIYDELLKDPKTFAGAGDYELGESSGFVSTVKVTEPIKRFDEQVLAAHLLKTHKVPFSATITAVALAKVPKDSSRTIKIIPRGE